MRPITTAMMMCAASSLIACSGAGTAEATKPSATWSSRFAVEGDLGDGTALLAPVKYQSLTLVPIVATGETSSEDFLVLDEAMEKGLVTIAEQGEGNVNSLTLVNRSKQPLFVMSGEVVIGGKQDRIIGKNTVVAQTATEAVPVFCVEHGRWSGRQAGFSTAGVLAHSSLRSAADYDDQSDVWEEVAEKNEKRGTSNPTNTYRASAAQQKGSTVAAFEEHFDASLGKLPALARLRVVGYVVALNGEVVAVDVFENPRLLAKLDRKLRRSYYAEAIDVPAAADAPVPNAASVKAFVARAESAPEEQVHDGSESATYNNVADDTASTKVMSKKARATGGAKPRALFKSVKKHTRTK